MSALFAVFDNTLLCSLQSGLHLYGLLQTGVELANVKMSMNPFCEIAVEVFDTMLMPSQPVLCGSAASQLTDTCT